MCGIIGMTQKNNGSAKNDLLAALKRLEYRGYDSCGFATSEGIISKEIGKISTFIDQIDDLDFTTAICHTRWGTHGGITKINAHPHFNEKKTIFAVHNGILENFAELRKMLEDNGYNFVSDTDSEIIPHYFDMELAKGKTVEEVIRKFFIEAKGTFAVLLVMKEQDKIYAFKKDSPLVLGLCKDKIVLASDIYAFSNLTDKAIFFDDYQYAVISPERFHFYDKEGNLIKKEITRFEWSTEEETKEEFSHYMIKEIKEQPVTSKRLIGGLATIQHERLDKIISLIRSAGKIVFVSCGTSYHASLIGAHLLGVLGFSVHAIIASEFDTFYNLDENTLVIALSQSGETMDVVTVLKEAKKKGASVASIVNVPYSTIQRLSDISLEIQAGQEISVASTKAFTNQVILLLAIAKELGYKINLEDIPERISKTIEINESIAKDIAEELYKKNDIFVLGKGPSYPVAREIALKLKEVAYVHAEGMMAGELKHGTIALVEEGTPVISMIPNNNSDMISSTKEVEARGARILIISNTNGDFHLPESGDCDFAIYAAIVGHLLSYYIALKRECEIDFPRNLAKSVTVR